MFLRHKLMKRVRKVFKIMWPFVLRLSPMCALSQQALWWQRQRCIISTENTCSFGTSLGMKNCMFAWSSKSQANWMWKVESGKWKVECERWKVEDAANISAITQFLSRENLAYLNLSSFLKHTYQNLLFLFVKYAVLTILTLWALVD